MSDEFDLNETEGWVLDTLTKVHYIGIIAISICMLSLLGINYFYHDIKESYEFAEVFSLIFGVNIGIYLFASIFYRFFTNLLLKKRGKEGIEK